MTRYEQFCEMSGIPPDGAEFIISPPLGAPGWGVIIKHDSGSDDVSIIAVSSGFGTAQVPGSEKLTIAEELDKLGEIMSAGASHLTSGGG